MAVSIGFQKGYHASEQLSTPCNPHHFSPFDYDYYRIGDLQSFDAVQAPNFAYSATQSAPLAPGVWEIDNLERLFQHADSIAIDRNEHQSKSFDAVQGNVPILEDTDWSPEVLHEADLSSSSQRNESSKQADTLGKVTPKSIKPAPEQYSEQVKSKYPSEIDWYRSL